MQLHYAQVELLQLYRECHALRQERDALQAERDALQQDVTQAVHFTVTAKSNAAHFLC